MIGLLRLSNAEMWTVSTTLCAGRARCAYRIELEPPFVGEKATARRILTRLFRR
jgi:hypothetical protein